MEKFNYIGAHCKIECDKFKTGYGNIDEAMDNYLKAICTHFERNVKDVLAMKSAMDGKTTDEEFLAEALILLGDAKARAINTEAATLLKYGHALGV